MLEIKELHVSIDGRPILQGLNFKAKAGEIHAIMGPNGSGKSTLAKVIAGHPDYQVDQGEILFSINNSFRDIKELSVSDRAKEGIFLGHQYPVEVPGVSNLTFLHESFNQICKHHGADELDPYEFRQLLKGKLELLEMKEDFIKRSVNEGFSGGEKKKNEILQLCLLNPRLALLDETDSGLDIDALKIVAKGVNAVKSKFNAIVLVTHYQRLLDYIIPDFVHILYQRKIIASGDKSLALEIEKHGYDPLIKKA